MHSLRPAATIGATPATLRTASDQRCPLRGRIGKRNRYWSLRTSSPRKRYQHPSLRHYAPFQMRWKGTQQTRWKRTQATTQPNQITTETEWFGPVTQGMVTPHTGRCNLRQRLHGTKRGEVPSSSQSLTSPYTPSFSRTPPAFFFPLGPIQIKRVPSPTNRQKQNGESRF
jgi:hypothetical protein